MNRVVVLAALVWVTLASAQEARLSGTISDSSGGAIPSVNVVAMQGERQLTFQTQSDPDGRFLFPKLPIGTYQIKAGH